MACLQELYFQQPIFAYFSHYNIFRYLLILTLVNNANDIRNKFKTHNKYLYEIGSPNIVLLLRYIQENT